MTSPSLLQLEKLNLLIDVTLYTYQLLQNYFGFQV